MTHKENESQGSGSFLSEANKQLPTNLISRRAILQRLRRSREARARFLDSNLSKELAFQLRSLREKKSWSQPELAKMTDTSQNAISRLENPNYGKATLTTLKKLAAVYDVGLVVRFVPFSQLVNWESRTEYLERGFGFETFDVQTFEEEEKNGALDESPKSISPDLLRSIQGEAQLGGDITQLIPNADESARPSEVVYKGTLPLPPVGPNQVITNLGNILETCSGQKLYAKRTRFQRKGARRLKRYARRKVGPQRQAA
jgi:transcriptional regulator with XRE-family HTH domain